MSLISRTPRMRSFEDRTRQRTRARRRLQFESLEDRAMMAANVAVTFGVTSDWQSGFGAAIAIKNNGAAAISGWTLEFDFNRNLDQIWNAAIVSHQGTHYVVKDVGYNSVINAGATVSFGFNGSPGNVTTPPSNYIFNGGSTGGGPGTSTPSITIGDASASEGQSGTTPLVFTVQLSSAAASAVTVAYSTAAGTATAGSDYTSTSGTLTFAPGVTKQTITVQVNGDTTNEPDETLSVNLSAAGGATIAAGQALGTILNDDSPPIVADKNYGEALQKALFFYESARSGDLPDGYPVAWRADSALNDGKDVGLDLTGGYYDAGDHVKFGLPMAYSMSMLAWGVDQYRDAYAQSGQLDDILAAIKWGTDYIIKAHPSPNVFYGQVGRGDLDHAFWGAPELMTMDRPAFKIDAAHPGSDLAGQAAAALASAAIAFQATDPVYAALLIQHAEQLYSFADTYRGKYSDSIPDAANYYTSTSGYQDELVWGAVWLYKATGKTSYLDKAEAIYTQYFAGQTMTWTQSWDDSRYGAAVLLAQVTGKETYKKDAERWLDYWSVGTNGGATRIAYTPGGLAFLNGWGSLRYASTTAFVAFVYSDTVRDYNHRYHDFAVKQINYILGDNPRNFSYEVGFGDNYPKNPHHRGASGVWDGNVGNPTPNRHILYGALVGGPESADDFNYHDDRTNYISNEVALDYNAGFTGALARMYKEYGGQPLASFPTPEQRDLEFFVRASINQQGPTFTEVRALLDNRSAWPARASTNLSFRYFVNLSEVYAAGYSVNDVTVTSNYSQGATLSPLLPWDAAHRIYYVDVSFAGVRIVPGAGTFEKEAQVRIGLKNGLPASAWDPTNDWSYQGLLAGRDQLTTTANIPVYEFGNQKLYGQTPGVAVPGTPSISIDNVSITEGNSGQKLATFNVRLSEPSSAPVTVAYNTADGTAKAGSDYVATAGTLTFAAGTMAQTITVPIQGDTLVESNETFALNLANAVNAVISTPQATATIVDDDGAPPPPPASSAVTFTVSDDWGTGFVASISIKNTQATAINGWTLEFDLPVNITSIWNAVIVSHVGNRYVIKDAGYNKTIAPGASISLGFQGTPGNVPKSLTNVLLNGVAV